jgi:hypothetical protein
MDNPLDCGAFPEEMAHLFTDEVRSIRLTKLAEKSITGLFRGLSSTSKQKSELEIRHLRGFIEAVSGYFNIEVHILLKSRNSHADAEYNLAGQHVGGRRQGHDGRDINSRVFVCLHCPVD